MKNSSRSLAIIEKLISIWNWGLMKEVARFSKIEKYLLSIYYVLIILQGDGRDLKRHATPTYRLVGRTYRPRREVQSGLCRLSRKWGWRGWCSHKGACHLAGVAGWGDGWQGLNDETHSPQVRMQSLTASTGKIRKNNFFFFLSNYERPWSGLA